VILLLAFTIGANVAMFSVLHQALIRPLPYAEPERLVMGRATFNGNINPDMSAYDYFDYRERNQVFQSVGLIMTGERNVTITGGDHPEQLPAATVSWDLLPTLGIPAAAGRHFLPAEQQLDGPAVVMISRGYWLRRFAAAVDVIGSTIMVDGAPRTVVGVMPTQLRALRTADIWVPMQRGAPRASSRGWHNWLMVARLRPGVTLEQAQADADAISTQLSREYPDTNRDKALLLTELHVVLAEGYQTAMILLMTAVGLVLLIACGNIASLLLARGADRRSELCVRAALGASSPRIVGQLLTESLVIATLGGALGTALAVCLQRVILSLVPVGVPGIEKLGVSWIMMVFALLVSLASGLLFGALPAVQAARSGIVSNLRSSGRSTDHRGRRFHSGLVVVQVAVSVALLIGSGLLLKSLYTLRAVHPGFDTSNLLTAEIRLASDKYPGQEARIQLFSGLTEELRALPGVRDVAVINQLPIRDPGNNIAVYATARPPADPNDRIPAYRRSVLPGYFAAMGVPLLRGRGIDTTDTAQAKRVLVVNETMARTLFPDENPIGQLVNIGSDIDCEVVGVVGDVRVSGPRYRPRFTMYSSSLQQPTLTMRLALRTTGEAAAVTAGYRRAVWRRDRDIPIPELISMEQIIARSVSGDSAIAVSVTLFAAVAALLAALGLYGVLAYSVSRRSHEIGVRIALGAQAKHVIIEVMKRGLHLVAAGILIGLAAAFWASRFLQRILFETAPTDAATFVVVSLLFMLVALIACLIPACKALKVSPVSALTSP
jgi:putative ABC transport system permease protein